MPLSVTALRAVAQRAAGVPASAPPYLSNIQARPEALRMVPARAFLGLDSRAAILASVVAFQRDKLATVASLYTQLSRLPWILSISTAFRTI